MKELALDIGGALALVVAYAAALALAARLTSTEQASGARSRLGTLITAIDERITARVLALSVTVLAAMGALVLVGDVPIEPFRINAERTIPAAFGTLLLFATGTLATYIGAAEADARRLAWIVVGVGLIALGFDEAAELHERVEVRTDLAAIVIGAPVAALLGIAWLFTIPSFGSRPGALARFAAGGLLWLASQALDPIHGVDYKSVLEETLELVGSSLMLLALLSVAKAAAANAATERPVAGDQ